ncbi:membrane lipoprotein lipid attachment site-containing protein [Virgibacillus indicus]|uniref:membrane lipoprotein lipid attachment site-containing protein n=1 Tax=Virgibacillus indicus TaxID=2024554 RepID=UPI001F0B3C8E|nr:membrane lipoprotein lipid attachment site-containing protein [Virgibacillus indicus]
MKKILTIFFAMIVLTACSGEENQYDYIFTGESEHWEAEYSFSGTEIWGEEDGTTTYSNENRDEFVLTYKGTLKELSSLESLEYSYDTSAGGGSGTREFDEPPKEVTFKSGGSTGNGAKVNDDEVIQVKVKWNDYEESFELHNESS